MRGMFSSLEKIGFFVIFVVFVVIVYGKLAN